MNFFTIRLSKDIDNFLKKLLLQEEKIVTIKDLNQNFNYIEKNSIFLLYVKGGATPSEWWIKDPDYRGTLFIATLNNAPEYYDDKNFKIEVNIRYRFNRPLTQEMCKFYPDTYNTEVGPKTKGSQTQAISFIQEEKQILGILRAALYYNPEAEGFYKDFFGDAFVNKIKSSISRFIEKPMDYAAEKSLKQSVSEAEKENPSNNTFPFPRNSIIFGAPGTGKSKTLNDLTNEYFVNRNNNDEKDIVFSEIEMASGESSKCFAIGYNHHSFLNGKSQKEIINIYHCTGPSANAIAQGIKAASIESKFSKADVVKNDNDIMNECAKIGNSEAQAAYGVIGRLYSDLLSGRTYNDLETNLKLTKGTSAAYWIVNGINSLAYKASEKIEKEHNRYERVTFHPNYSYSQFVGTYKPVSKTNETGEKVISYEYVPGPFINAWLKAYNSSEPYLLLIEEINRANVAAVFGDVFQLLDRDSNGESEYPIVINEDLKRFLSEKGIEIDTLTIPSNMYIWATMNSADQGVLPMDAAFKRRWDFEYIGINDNENWDYIIPLPNDESINWNVLRRALNDKLKKISGVNEDKLLGPYFISKSVLDDIQKDGADKARFISTFKSKVLMYLFEDVCKMRPTDLFTDVEMADGQTRPHYSDICAAFDKNGIGIFGFKKDDLENTYKKSE